MISTVSAWDIKKHVSMLRHQNKMLLFKPFLNNHEVSVKWKHQSWITMTQYYCSWCLTMEDLHPLPGQTWSDPLHLHGHLLFLPTASPFTTNPWWWSIGSMSFILNWEAGDVSKPNHL